MAPVFYICSNHKIICFLQKCRVKFIFKSDPIVSIYKAKDCVVMCTYSRFFPCYIHTHTNALHLSLYGQNLRVWWHCGVTSKQYRNFAHFRSEYGADVEKEDKYFYIQLWKPVWSTTARIFFIPMHNVISRNEQRIYAKCKTFLIFCMFVSNVRGKMFCTIRYVTNKKFIK